VRLLAKRVLDILITTVSACIDTFRTVPLGTDHRQINKFLGPDDIIFLTVYPLIVDLCMPNPTSEQPDGECGL
jgi:hypothetical protein